MLLLSSVFILTPAWAQVSEAPQAAPIPVRGSRVSQLPGPIDKLFSATPDIVIPGARLGQTKYVQCAST
jgi:hypothetical protein